MITVVIETFARCQLYRSRNRYTFFQQGLKGRNVTLNLITTNTRSPRQVVQSPATKVTGRTQSGIYAFLKSHQ